MTTPTQVTKNRRALTRRIMPVFAAVGVLVGVGFALRPAPVTAMPSTMTTHEFFSDETFTESVGFRIANSCYGVVNEVYGEVTPYVIKETEKCDGMHPPTLVGMYCPDYGCTPDGNGNLICYMGECVIL